MHLRENHGIVLIEEGESMTIGERIKQRRKDLGISAEELAAQLGKSPATIYRYEKGEIEKLPGELLEPLAAVLRTSPAWLMDWEQEQTAPEVRPITDSELKFALWGDAENVDDDDLAAVRQYAEFLKEKKRKQ